MDHSTGNKREMQNHPHFSKDEISGRGLDKAEHRQVWMKGRLCMETEGHKNRKFNRSGSWMSWAMKMFELRTLNSRSFLILT